MSEPTPEEWKRYLALSEATEIDFPTIEQFLAIEADAVAAYKAEYDDLSQRFWAMVEQTPGCWNWRGVTTSGYGRIKVHGHTVVAHRVAWELLRGPIPEGLTLDHLCRNRGCVNPDHLEPVTGRENTLRGVGASAQQARKTHCKRGHPFDEKNTRACLRRGKPYRECRTCKAMHMRERRARRSAAKEKTK